MSDSTNTASVLSTNTSENTFQQIKKILHKEHGDTTYKSWIHPIQFNDFQNGVLSLSVPTRFIRDWVKTHYADTLQTLWSRLEKPCIGIDLSIDAKTAHVTDASFNPLPVANENNDTADFDVNDISSPLDGRFTFDTFIAGTSNEFAMAGAKQVATSAETSFNPLFIHGGVGMGKTHLLHAIAAHIRHTDPERKVVYMSAEKFMYQFVRALRANDTMAFKEKFRQIDVLLIDDIQFICGKKSTQQEFFHTFNALIDQGKQVVLSSSKAPSSLNDIDDRLKSRLGMGLVAKIQNADEALRLAILKSKCALMNRDVPNDVLTFLSTTITSNIREVEGALNRLIAHSDLVNKEITLAGAQEILHDLVQANNRKVTIDDIQKAVAEHYNIRVADILSPRRSRVVARPRQVAMYLCKYLTQHSLPDIGRGFAGRDHTTIMHGIRKIETLIKQDNKIAEDVETLKLALNGTAV